MAKINRFNFFIFGLIFSIDALSINLSSPTIVKEKSVSTRLISTPLYKSVLPKNPKISGFGSTGCIKPGTNITILGSNFGTKKYIALGKSNNYIPIKPAKWLSNNITAYIPKDSRIKTGARYFVGIRNAKNNSWLSNTDKYVTICSSKIRTLRTTVLKPEAKKTTPSKPVRAPIDSSSQSESNYDDFGTQIILPGSQSSLMDRQLPPPPPDLKDAAQEQDKSINKKIEPSEIIVISNDMNEARELSQQLGSYGLSAKKRKILKSLKLVITTFRVPAGTDLQDTAISIRQTYPKMWADVNHRYQLLGNNRDTNIAKKIINWNKKTSQCGKGLRIGLLDTEINTSHPALKSQKITSHSVITHGVKKAKSDHGTAIATLLIGDFRTKYFSGMLPSARLFSAAIFRQRDKKNIDTTAEWIVSAIDWLLSQKVNVINMSIGGPRNLLVDIAIQRTIKSGIPVIAAAGNGGSDAAATYPAAQPGVIAVTAVDNELEIYSKASHGKYIDFAAPGVDIWAGNSNGAGKFVSGTSFSVPFVTASIASLINKYGSKKSYSILQKSAKDLGTKGKDSQFGWGLVQAPENCQ